MADSVEICSYLMGSNKTNSIIKWMSDNPDERYIYVIPNLNELQDTEYGKSRVLSIGFKTPESGVEYKTKSEHLYNLCLQGESIACTHVLYKMLDKRTLEVIKNRGYILVIDEEVALIDSYTGASPADLVSLLNDGKVAISEEDGMVVWTADENTTLSYLKTEHKHHRFYKHIINENIYTTKQIMTGDKYKSLFMVSQITKEVIECAKRVVIITYLFKGSILDCFLQVKGFKVKKFLDVQITEETLENIVSRITLLPYDEKMDGLKLSSSWWDKISTKDLKTVESFIRRTARRSKLPPSEVMWTVPSNRTKWSKSMKAKVSPQGFVEGKEQEPCWIACTMRATNRYAHKKLAIHCFNRYPHVSVNRYLLDYNQTIDQDKYAVAELLQWLFRSNIRMPNGEVTLAIGSRRMYNLYLMWANGEIKDEL